MNLTKQRRKATHATGLAFFASAVLTLTGCATTLPAPVLSVCPAPALHLLDPVLVDPPPIEDASGRELDRWRGEVIEACGANIGKLRALNAWSDNVLKAQDQ